jgi:hypothetical protein
MGPAIATLTISAVGVEGVVWIYALLYLVGMVLTYFIHVDQPGLEHQIGPDLRLPPQSNTSKAI